MLISKAAVNRMYIILVFFIVVVKTPFSLIIELYQKISFTVEKAYIQKDRLM